MIGKKLQRYVAKTAAMVLAFTAFAGSAALAQQSTFNCLTPSRQATARIVGGQTTSYNQFPWQVSIGAKGRGTYDAHFCGGVLIGARWVVTAGHCVYAFGPLAEPDQLHVVHGISNLRSEQGATYDVERVIPHPNYANENIDRGNDIALIKLSQPVSANSAAYALLPQASIARNFVFPEACSVVTGWGTTRPGEPLPNDMQAVAMPIISNEECARAYANHGRPAPLDSDVCAGFLQGGIDSCQGDSGGPLVVEGGPKGYVLAGIVSRGGYDNPTGFWCALEEGYGIYTRVESFVPWIVQTIRDN